MTKSRTLPALLLTVAFLCAAPVAAQAPAASAGIIAAPPDPLGDIATRQRIEEERCRGAEVEAIVVCGRLPRRGAGYRVPYQPEPGARVRLIAGEARSGIAAMGADYCERLCQQPLRINLLDPGSIVRGLDRILGGD